MLFQSTISPRRVKSTDIRQNKLAWSILNFVVSNYRTSPALIISDEDPGLRIESFAIIQLRGVTTKFKIYFFTMLQTFKELKLVVFRVCGKRALSFVLVVVLNSGVSFFAYVTLSNTAVKRNAHV